MKTHNFIILLLLISLPCFAQLNIYKSSMTPNDDFTVRVREQGGVWQDLYEYRVDVDMDNVRQASMVEFDMGSKPVDVMVKKNNGKIYDVDIRPFSKNIDHRVEKNAILFTIDKPQYLSIEVNGDRVQNLHFFANPTQSEVYNENDSDIIYFAPGVHRPKDLPGNEIRIPSNKTVYLAPGAVVKAKLLIDNAENVRIVGRGILDHPVRGIEITYSKNIYIDGVTVVNPDHYTVFGGQSENIKINNLKSFSCKGWSDGIDLMSCSNVHIDNVFMRNSDDCIALYAHRWNFYGDVKNILIENSVLWADVAHPVNIGGHGNYESPSGETLEGITIRNIDILEHDEDDYPYQGCMAIDAGDNNLVKNVVFDNIRVENIQEGRLFYLKVRFNEKYDKLPGRGIENITFRNITYDGIGENRSVIEGFDKDRMIRNVTFENVFINGVKMKNINDFITNQFISGIKVK